MNKTGIEYLDYTWNPVAMRCTPVSKGCENCWHITRAKMLANNPMISEDAQKAYAGRTGPLLIKSRLEQPRKVKKPSMIGVQFMGDLFHEDVADFMIDSVFIHIKQMNHHTFIVLTKRPKRMKSYFQSNFRSLPKNVWTGITIEHEKYIDRIYDLFWVVGNNRLLSFEPLLSKIDFLLLRSTPERPHIDWVICGPETGPGARECKPEWIEDLYEQCKAAGVPFFDKSKNYLAREFPKGA